MMLFICFLLGGGWVIYEDYMNNKQDSSRNSRVILPARKSKTERVFSNYKDQNEFQELIVQDDQANEQCEKTNCDCRRYSDLGALALNAYYDKSTNEMKVIN